MSHPQDVFDEARYVEFSEDGLIVAVWHGSHTINVYEVHSGVYEPVDAIGVGDFVTGETTLQDVKDGIQILFDVRNKQDGESND